MEWMLSQMDIEEGHSVFNIDGEAKMPLTLHFLAQTRASEIFSELSDTFGFRFIWVSCGSIGTW